MLTGDGSQVDEIKSEAGGEQGGVPGLEEFAALLDERLKGVAKLSEVGQALKSIGAGG